MTVDVVTVGEAMLRLSVPPGSRLEETRSLNVHVAGAEANTAVALAALGRTVKWWSRLPDSPLGRRVARELRAAGVDTSQVGWDADTRIGVYYVELAAPPRPVSVVYDRADSAAAVMASDDFPLEELDSARVAHLSGVTPALSDSCRRLALDFAEHARLGSCLLTVDVNYRAKLWSPEEARRTLLEIGEGADVVVLTREDARDVFGYTGDIDAVLAKAQRALAASAVVLTLGEQGAAWLSDHDSGHVAAHPTTIVDRLGAGDAFMAGVIEGLLTDDFERGVRIGTVLASLALGTDGDHALTTSEEVLQVLEGGGRSVDR